MFAYIMPVYTSEHVCEKKGTIVTRINDQYNVYDLIY